MAALELRDGVYRIDFRFGGKRFRRSLKTERERTALSALARADDTLRRLELGQLTLPAGADVATFILSDGKSDQKQKASEFPTLGALLDEYLRTLTPGTFEETTDHCVRIHIRHFRRVFGEKQSIASIDVQRYVDCRATAAGLRGRTLSATTIKKELGTLGMIWTWAINKGYVDQPLARKGLRFPKTADKPPFQTIEDVERKIAAGGLPEGEIGELWDSVFLTLPEIAIAQDFRMPAGAR